MRAKRPHAIYAGRSLQLRKNINCKINVMLIDFKRKISLENKNKVIVRKKIGTAMRHNHFFPIFKEPSRNLKVYGNEKNLKLKQFR